MKDLWEDLEIFLCDLFDLKRINDFHDAYDNKLNEAIEIKLASRYVIDDDIKGTKRSGRFQFRKTQHNKLSKLDNPQYLFCVYHLNGYVEILGIKKVPWNVIDQQIDFSSSDWVKFPIKKVFRVSELKPVFTIWGDVDEV